MARLYTSEVFQVGLLYYLVLNSGWSVSINVNKTRKHFPETFMAHACSTMFPSFPYGKHCFQCQFLFSRSKSCLRYATGKFNENPRKNLRARASDHLCNFSEKFEQIEWDHSTPLIITMLGQHTGMSKLILCPFEVLRF